MRVISVSFVKKFAPDGTVYRKAIKVPESMMHDINYHLALEARKAEKAGDQVRKMNLLKAFPGTGNTFFTNLTQQAEILKFIKGLDYCHIDEKRASFDANMAIILE